MTTEKEPTRPGHVVNSLLPWLLAAGMLAVYLLTLCPGVSSGNLAQVVELSGWNWRPDVFASVTFIVTYPLRWLPASVIALAANLFSALCAALTLGLLARSVTLLPERSRLSFVATRSAWLPPVLAVLACGLQITFWENSIQAAGEMLDLLLFAFVVRCLLEFRLNRKQSWLNRFAVVYGLALANDWAMVGFLPFFLVAFLWTRPLGTLNLRFIGRAARVGWKTAAPELAADLRLILRLTLLGLAGLSLILVPPLIASLSHARHLEFLPGLRLVLGSYKYLLLRFPRGVALLLSLTSVLPVVFMGIRFRGSLFRVPNAGLRLMTTRGAIHLIHGSFLIACIWVTLDCPVSPRHQGLGYAFLPFYYLGALSIGYFSGYFLLVFGTGTPHARRRPPVSRLIDPVVTGCIWLLLIAVPCLLLYRSLPQIRANNHNPLQSYFALVEKSLPAQGTVIMSDDPFRLYYFQAALAGERKQSLHLFLDTTALGNPAYRQFLGKKLQTTEALFKSHGLYYLHPSFGYYFETFYPLAHGLVYQLKPYGTNVSEAPLPTQELMAENQTFWRAAMTDQLPSLLRTLRQREPPSRPNPIERLLAFARLKREPDPRARFVATCYSRALDCWGAELQGCGAYPEAAKYFSVARELHPDNVAARVNQEFNQAMQSGKQPVIQPAAAFEDKSGRRREWDKVLQEDGPFAEPNACYQVGVAFARNGLNRQAIQQFSRAQKLAPDQTDARLWLARLFIQTRNYSNVLAIADHILQTSPTDDSALFLKAVSLLQSKAYEDAIAPFTHLLTVQTNNYAAQLNRAIAYLQLGKLDAARRDFEEVAKAIPQSHQAWFGLAEIAYRQKDPLTAITNYQNYLAHAPPDTEEARLVISRLNELKRDQR